MIILENLLDVIQRMSESHLSLTDDLVNSKDYSESKPNGILRKILDRSIEQSHQDCAMIKDWIERQRKFLKEGN